MRAKVTKNKTLTPRERNKAINDLIAKLKWNGKAPMTTAGSVVALNNTLINMSKARADVSTPREENDQIESGLKTIQTFLDQLHISEQWSEKTKKLLKDVLDTQIQSISPEKLRDALESSYDEKDQNEIVASLNNANGYNIAKALSSINKNLNYITPEVFRRLDNQPKEILFKRMSVNNREDVLSAIQNNTSLTETLWDTLTPDQRQEQIKNLDANPEKQLAQYNALSEAQQEKANQYLAESTKILIQLRSLETYPEEIQQLAVEELSKMTSGMSYFDPKNASKYFSKISDEHKLEVLKNSKFDDRFLGALEPSAKADFSFQMIDQYLTQKIGGKKHLTDKEIKDLGRQIQKLLPQDHGIDNVKLTKACNNQVRTWCEQNKIGYESSWRKNISFSEVNKFAGVLKAASGNQTTQMLITSKKKLDEKKNASKSK